MSVTAGAIILGSAILGAVGGSVGTTMATNGIFGDSSDTVIVQQRGLKKNEQRVIIEQNREPNYTTYPCIYYDASGQMHYYYKENGCY